MKKIINEFLCAFGGVLGGVLGGVTAIVTLETLSVLSKKSMQEETEEESK